MYKFNKYSFNYLEKNMPVKFAKSFKQFNKESKRTTMVHDYIKNKSQDELFEYINSDNGKPKIKQKCRNELSRRGIRIVKVPKVSD